MHASTGRPKTNTAKSFIEILEDEIRQDLRSEIEAEVEARYGVNSTGGAGSAQKGNGAEQAPSAAVHAAGRLETWLASHVGPVTFGRPAKAAQKAYGTPRKSNSKASATPSPESVPPSNIASINEAKPVASKILFNAETTEELVALEILNRHASMHVASSFTADELKSLWRKSALKSHPDRFADADEVTKLRMSAVFRELAEAYATLHTKVRAAA